MRRLLLVCLLLAWAAPSLAVQTVISDRRGTLDAADACGGGAPCSSAKRVDATNNQQIYFYSYAFWYCIQAGSATVKTQWSPDNGTHWIDVGSSTKSLVSPTLCDGVSGQFPDGWYQTVITAIAGGAQVTTGYLLGGRILYAK